MLECKPGIFKIEPTKITPSKYISFFVERESGNLLFPCLSSSSTFQSSWLEIHERGGVAMQLLGDMHFATKDNDALHAEFNAMTFCSEGEEADVRRKVKNVEAFPFERVELSPGVVALPTPGHRPGAVSYLLDVRGTSVLFAGDSIWHDGEKWKALSNKKNRNVMKNTLTELCAETFTTLYVNSSVTNPTYSIEFDTLDDKNEFLDGLATEL